jgi:hypothetical protein
LERGFDRLRVLLLGNVTKFPHPPQSVLLTLACPLRISNRIIGRGGFWQAREDGGLPEAQFVERMPK